MPKKNMKWDSLQLYMDSSSYEKQYHSGMKNVKRKINTKNKLHAQIKHLLKSGLSHCSCPDTHPTSFGLLKLLILMSLILIYGTRVGAGNGIVSLRYQTAP